MSSTDKLAPGTVLGRYELLLPIAQGGMATVWAARLKGSRGFQKTVAVKTMLPNLSDDPQFEQMFLDEAALASRIHHPNVAEILDLGEQDEILYLVMEWVDGEALSVISKTAKRNHAHMQQRIALRIVSMACAGLHAAHELKDETDRHLELVHRDVSPQNILVTYDGIVKLVDFGVAKAVGRAGGETTAGQLKGKVPYMSPEQAKGGKVDRRTDIFAMGIVLYKLATGLHPFLGDNDMLTMRNIITKGALPPRNLNPNFSPELEQVILKCLAKDPAERYQTMADLDRAIDRVLAISGASVVDDDVGSFVRNVMGDRGQKRRVALRDAVRQADERAAGIAIVPSAPSTPVIHEGLSELVLTKMASGVSKGDILPADLPPISSRVSEPVELSDADVKSAVSDGEPKRRNGILIGAIVAVAALLGAGALRLAGGSHAGAAPPPPPSAAPTATASAPTAQAADPGASAKPAASDAPALSVAELPNVDDKAGSKKPLGTLPAKAPASAREAPTAAPTYGKPKWSPTVQNPGF
jgi:serine/threonine-protein kinase